MKLLKPLLYSALIGLSIPAMVSCDSSPFDQTGGTLDFDLERFDVAAITAAPTATAAMPQLLKEGDVITLTATSVTRRDENIATLAYESTMTVNNTRQVELQRRPPSFTPIIAARFASYDRSNDNVNSGTLSTTDSIDEPELQRLVRNVLADNSSSLNEASLREALRIVGDPATGTVEEDEAIQAGFQAFGIEAWVNQSIDPKNDFYITIRREIVFTATSTNADITGSSTISGTYQIIEHHRNLVLWYTTTNGVLDSPFYEPTFENGGKGEFSSVAEEGVFTLTLNGLSAN